MHSFGADFLFQTTEGNCIFSMYIKVTVLSMVSFLSMTVFKSKSLDLELSKIVVLFP